MKVFNTTKIYKRIQYFKNLFRYFYFRAVAFISIHGKREDIEIIKKHCDVGEKEFVFLGNVEKDFTWLDENKKQIKMALGNPAASFFFSDKNEKSVELDNDFHVISKKRCIVDFNDVKIGFTNFDLDLMLDEKKNLREILKERRILLQGGANLLVAFVSKGEKRLNSGKIKKIIGRSGFDIVIGVGGRIRYKRNFRTVTFGETRILYSLGQIDKSKNKRNNFKSYTRPSAAFKVAVKKNNKKIRITKEGYLPLCLTFKGNDLCNFETISKEQIETDKVKKKYYLYIEKIMKGFRGWNEMITLSDIFRAIDADIPDKYKEISEYSVNQICARTFELSPGNVFFFRQQFNDRNDTHLQNELFRTRLAFKAFTRRSLFVFSYKKLPAFIPHVVVENAMEAHITAMAWYRKKYIGAKFIGITGSIGKTSTKDMVYCALSEGYRTNKNLRNTNVQVKIGLNMQSIPTDCELYVQEIGGGRPGGASRHSRMILPDVTVVTNIGSAHIGNYDSKEELMHNKLGIVDGMPEDGVLFLNGDDELLFGAAPDCKVVYYAVNNTEADYYADNIEERNGKMYFDVVHNGHRFEMMINVVGEYNVLNAVCAYAICKHFNMTDEDIARGISHFRTSGVRQNLIKVGQYTFFMDCYNASLESIDSSISVLETLQIKKGGKKIAIIGDITGAGQMQSQVNEEVAAKISDHQIRNIVLYGKQAGDIRKSLHLQGADVVCIDSRAKLEEWLKNNVKIRDIVLLKGSSKMKMDEIIDYVYGLNTADERYIDEAEYTRISKNDMNYRVFHDYASIKRYMGVMKEVNVKKKISGKQITKLWKKAFYGNESVEKVNVGDNVRHIGSECFGNCKNLKEVSLPDNVRYIGSRAFSGCENLKRIIIDGEIIFLGRKAFDGCVNLQEIVLPKNVSEETARRLKNINVKKIYR